MKKMAAIVLNWRSPHDTICCIRSLLSLDVPLDILVVDNASGDSSLKKIEEALAAGQSEALERGMQYVIHSYDGTYPTDSGSSNLVLLVQAEKNGGYAYGNNIGLRIALAQPDIEYFWILNSDTIVPDSSSLSELARRMEEDKKLGLCGSTVVYLSHPDTIQTQAGGRFYPETGRSDQIGAGVKLDAQADQASVEKELSYVNGAATFVRRAFLDEIGLMDERYFLYFEELDWAFRAKGKFKLGYAPKSIVLHKVGGSIGTSDTEIRSPTSTYYLTRSKLKFLIRFSKRSCPVFALDLLREIKFAIKIRNWQNLKAIVYAVAGVPWRPQ